MKAVMIIFNQAHTEKVEYMLDFLEINGYSQWADVTGRGTYTGEPHYGTHTWPEMNSAVLTIVEESMVPVIFAKIKKIDEMNKDVGIRAFVWNIEQQY
jgi:nitrogen regulatory protein PII